MRSILESKNKRGQVNTLTASILAVTLAVVTFVFGLTLINNLQSTQTVNTLVYNETTQAITGYTGFNDYWSLIVLAVVIGIVFALIFGAFGGRARR